MGNAVASAPPGAFWATLAANGYISAPAGVSTSAALGNNSLRVCPLYSPAAYQISGIGAEFTVAGDAASILHLGAWTDNGNGTPGVLLSDPGSISTGTGNAGTVATGGTPGVYIIPLATPVTIPAGLAWYGGAIQGVTTTQPTLRIATWNAGFAGGATAVPSPGGVITGYSTPASGAMPSPYTAFPASAASAFPRISLLVSALL